MGWMQRSDPDHPQVLRIEGRGRNTLQIKDNRINIEMDAAPGWNLGRFRRSLHRLAFGYLALVHGSDYVLQEKFNPVRSYIRKPKSGEKWPYGETTISDKLIKRISIDFVDGESISIIQIQLFNAIFFIDLFHSANFPEWLKANNVTLK